MPTESQNLTALVVRKPKAKPNVKYENKLQLEISSITLAVLLYLLIFTPALIALLHVIPALIATAYVFRCTQEHGCSEARMHRFHPLPAA